MPFMKDGKRDYKRELAWEKNTHPNRVKDRAERNTARSDAMKSGQVHKGDGKQVDHIKALSQGGSATDKSNRRVVPAKINESFSRNSDGSMKRNDGAERARHKK